MLSQLREKFLNGENVSCRVRVENDDVIEIGGNVSEGFDTLIYDLDDSCRRRAAPRWNDEPLEEACGRAESREGNRVSVDRHLMERKRPDRTGRKVVRDPVCRGGRRFGLWGAVLEC